MAKKIIPLSLPEGIRPSRRLKSCHYIDIVIYQSVPVVLNPDKVFETEGEPAPGVGFKLWQIDEKVGPGDLGRVRCQFL